MKTFLFLVLFFSLTKVAQASDTLHVVTHRNETVVTDPSKGFHLYKRWGVFPSETTPVRKIILRVRFACPDSLRCADWDYKDHITLRRKGGVNGPSQDIELARMLTPYGGAFAIDWRFNWEVDITDFSLLLRDSVEIEYNHTGYEPANDRGWGVTLDFEIIKGTPAARPISIQKIYDNSYRYGDSTNSIENALKPVPFRAAEKAAFARLRVVQTGHGMDRPDGCAEFCNKYRQVFYDGNLIDTRPIWKECGDNPLYPQAGTWIYDRAAWCPGNLMQPDIYDLKVKPGMQHTIDINMQHYVSTNPSADEVISAYLIQYSRPVSNNDVQVTDIINPSTKDAYRRFNPSGLQPKVIVQNMGSQPVTSMKVFYGTKGFSKKELKWKGLLPPFAQDTITLPGTIESKPGTNWFEVELQRPNGRGDGFMPDNRISSPFEGVKKHDSMVVVVLQTNNQPSQTAYNLTNDKGQVVKQRAYNSLQANTLYRDTLVLRPGVYRFTLLDSADNGLEFWANPRGGRGLARLLNKDGQMIKEFEPDFGSFVQYDFEVGQPAEPVTPQWSFSLYPTRTNDKTTLDYFANSANAVLVQILTDPGNAIVEEHRYRNLKEGVFTYDLSRFPKGRFYLKVIVDGAEKFKKRIRLKE